MLFCAASPSAAAATDFIIDESNVPTTRQSVGSKHIIIRGAGPFTIGSISSIGNGGALSTSGALTIENPQVTFSGNSASASSARGGAVCALNEINITGGTTTVTTGNLFRSDVRHTAGLLDLGVAQKLHYSYTLGAGATLAFTADSATGSTTPVIDADNKVVTLEGGSFVRAKVGGALARAAEGTQADYLVIDKAAATSTYKATLQTASTVAGVDNSLFSIERIGVDP